MIRHKDLSIAISTFKLRVRKGSDSNIFWISQRAEDKGIVDKTEPHTTSLMYALGDTVNYAYGDQTNIKITTKEDIKLFEGYALMEKLSDKGELRCQQRN